MKQPNKHITRIVSGAVSASILTSSCVYNGNQIYSDDLILADIGVPAVKIDFTKKELDYFKFLDKLAEDIIKNPQIASEFSKAPSNYLRSQGYERDVNLQDDLLNLVLALADEDINAAITSNDIKTYLRLIIEKGLLSNMSSYSEDILAPEQKKELLLSIGVSEDDIDDFIVPVVAVPVIFYIAGAVISYAAILYTAVVSVNLAVAMAVAIQIGVVTSTKGGSGSNSGIPVDPIFDVWILKGEYASTYISLPESEIKEAIHSALSVFKKTYPAEVNAVNPNQLEQTINLNVIKQQEGLSKSNLNIFNK